MKVNEFLALHLHSGISGFQHVSRKGLETIIRICGYSPEEHKLLILPIVIDIVEGFHLPDRYLDEMICKVPFGSRSSMGHRKHMINYVF